MRNLKNVMLSRTTWIIGRKNGEVFVTRRNGFWKQESVTALAARIGLTGPLKVKHVNRFGPKSDDFKIAESFFI